MNRRAVVVSLFLLAACLGTPAFAAKCSGGTNCHACKNCSACKHCAKDGGSCSACRPDLYRQTSAPASTPAASTPVYAAPRPKAAPTTKATKAALVVPKEFTSRCVGVTDGDTMRVLYVSGETKSEIKIRLYGIDAPESKQAFGTQSKKQLSDLAFGKDVKIYSKGRDRYGRLLAWLFVGSTSINGEMVKTGFAWWYQKYSPKEDKLKELEASAREERRGLWSDAAPVAPWEWRNAR